MSGTRIKVDPAVQCYDPYYRDRDGYQLKSFEYDPRCVVVARCC